MPPTSTQVDYQVGLDVSSSFIFHFFVVVVEYFHCFFVEIGVDLNCGMQLCLRVDLQMSGGMFHSGGNFFQHTHTHSHTHTLTHYKSPKSKETLGV